MGTVSCRELTELFSSIREGRVGKYYTAPYENEEELARRALPVIVTAASAAIGPTPTTDIPDDFICPITQTIMTDPVYDPIQGGTEVVRFERNHF